MVIGTFARSIAGIDGMNSEMVAVLATIARFRLEFSGQADAHYLS